MLAQGFAYQRTNGQVRHVMIVHHVEVHDVCAGSENIINLLAQSGEVGGKNARAI